MNEVTMIVIRLGVPHPCKGDMIAAKLIREDLNIAGSAIPVGIVNIFKTDKSVSEIMDIFRQAESEANDNLPVVVFKLEDRESCAMKLNQDHIDNLIQEFEAAERKQVNMTLDDLLDKIHREGMSSLTEPELDLLKSLTGNK